MQLPVFFAMLGGLLVLAFVANRLVRHTRVPDVVVLMTAGVLLGPVLHWVNSETFRGVVQGFGSLALMLILFESGLDLKIREILNHFLPGLFLAVFSYVLTMGVVAALSHFALRFAWIHALMVGAIVGCISSSILIPVLQQVSLRREVKITLLVESCLGDAFAVLAVTTLVDIAAGGTAGAKAIAWSLASNLLLAICCGVLAGMLWSYLLPILSEERFWHVLTFAAVLLVYSGVHLLRGNELVSVLVFGLTLSNFPIIRERLSFEQTAGAEWFNETSAEDGPSIENPHRDLMLTFHGELAFLLRTFFFVLLGVMVDYADIRKISAFAIVCFAAILLARLIAVQAGRIGWRTFSSRERELMVWFVPRGLITAVLAIEVQQVRGVGFDYLPSLAFAVVLLTNLTLVVGTIRCKSFPAAPQPKREAAATASFP